VLIRAIQKENVLQRELQIFLENQDIPPERFFYDDAVPGLNVFAYAINL